MLAVVGIVVLVVAVIALRNPHTDGPKNAGQSVAVSDSPAKRTSSAPAPSPSPTRTGSTTAPPVSLGGSSSSTAAKAVPLIVLNDTTVAGLAKTAAARFEAGGWTVSSSGNLTNDILSTCAYYDPATSGAKAAAKALQAQFPTIKRVAPRFAELPSGPVVVVLTPDYQSD